MTDDELLQQRRRGYWLRLARDRRGLILSAAAEAAGLSAGSGSTVSLWENGERAIKVIHLERLARAYGVPLGFFMKPDMTDDERLEEAIRSASDAERRDWDQEQGQDREDDDEPDASPGRRSA